MRKRNTFSVLDPLREEDWEIIEDELLGGGGGGDRGRRGGGRGPGDEDEGPAFPRGLLWLIVPFVVISLFNWGLGFLSDWYWYTSLGFSSVFLTRFVASTGLFLAGALVFWLFLAFNVVMARRLEPRGLAGTSLSQMAHAVGVRITPIVLLIGAVFAFFMGSVAGSYWEELLLYLNQVPFGVRDPLFGQDVGFYIFTLPVWQIVRNWAFIALLITLIATALVSGLGLRSWNASAAVRAHLSGLGALLLLLIAWQYRLDAYQLVYSTRGAVFGAGYTDVHAQLPAYNLLTLVTLVAAVLLLVNVFLRQTWRMILAVLMAWVAISFLAGNLYPSLVQRFQVSPNEYALEQPYIEHNIRFTRQAFDLDTIQEQPYDVSVGLTPEAINRHPDTIRNIRLWDYRPLLQTYNQIQALRQYYEFEDIDIDRYQVQGNLQQVMLAARELIPERLAQEAQTWVNRKLVYTHGYGVAMSPVAKVTRDGLPEFLLKDLPPRGALELRVPQIYFGERTLDYVIVRTNVPEFDYPQEGGNVFTRFEADSGIPIGSFLTRLLFALRFGDVNILLTDAIQPDSRLLWRREIRSRAAEIAPFLVYDQDPYIVLSDDGKLYWIHDAYTVSSRYPYSTRLNSRNPVVPNWRINYIRNAVKVVTDAYTGEITYYLVDEQEPIIAAYRKIFPELFRPLSEMPQGLRKHIRYPNDLFAVQAEVYRIYHMTDPAEFYNREDVWEWPEEFFDDRILPMEPYYVLMELPGTDGLDFIQILPFTPANRENMIAWLAATSDPDRYGEKIVYQFGKDTLFYGPKQIEARISQDPVISAQLSLWNQQGSSVIRGNLLVIPLEDGLLYVEPLYLQAADGRIPELKRVIVATADRVVMAENLALALVELFGREALDEELLASLLSEGTTLPEAGRPMVPVPGLEGLTEATLEELIVQANDLYERAQAAIQQGDWATYGALMGELQQVLQQMEELIQVQ